MTTGFDYDVLIIGGGINGCGIARDAAGRGFSVCLCDSGDLAGGTSSGSTKLIHGGLRYLEYYEFRLVREALLERELLWSLAPHIVRPLRFILPHHSGLRPAWLLRLGLFLYDHLGGRRLLPPSQSLDLTADPAGVPLKSDFHKAFEYSDCWVDDARLVILNAIDAAERGADIRPRSRIVRAEPKEGGWSATLQDGTGRQQNVTARVIVNATGPWVDEVLQNVFGRNDVHNVRLVRGSHIVVPKCYEHDRCYVFQNTDGRIVFAIPYEHDYTLIGTTDIDHPDIHDRPSITDDEIGYLCDMANDYFETPVIRGDIVWTYSAVRPLYDDGSSTAQEATRDYVIEAETGEGDGLLLNIFGGKVTTYRRLAESALERIEVAIGQRGGVWTANERLPGGDFAVDGFDELVGRLRKSYPFLEARHLDRLVRLYGTRTSRILENTRSLADLGTHFGASLYEAEIRYLEVEEWAETAEDVLYRRTKLGLQMTPAEIDALKKRFERTGRARRASTA